MGPSGSEQQPAVGERAPLAERRFVLLHSTPGDTLKIIEDPSMFMWVLSIVLYYIRN